MKCNCNIKKIALVLFSLISFLFISCSDKVMGYSIVLWDIPEYEISSGETVPVYIKSNISHVYVIGTKNGEKIEVPLWKITDPQKKNKLKPVTAKYADNAHTYASVKLDGLPCRAEPVNTAKQVYRLRKGEVIKILYKGKGSAPMAGKKALEGDWYKILTSDGTQGWCFSYNLNLYETTKGNLVVAQVSDSQAEEKEDPYIDLIKTGVWYPDYFDSLIRSGNIDLARLNPSYNFLIDSENNKVFLNLEKIHESWNFTGLTKTAEKQYKLNDIPAIIIYKNQNYIVVRYTGESGKPEELNFIHLSQNLDEVIAAEKDRCTNAYLNVWTHGPVFKSSNYGKITFNEDGTFNWSSFKLLVPSVISASAKGNGTVSVKYALSKSLAASYDGVLTFKFHEMSKEVNFLYKLESNGIRLEDATSARFNGNLLVEKSNSSIVMFFSKN